MMKGVPPVQQGRGDVTLYYVECYFLSQKLLG